jgi:hypothetical protein
MLKQIKQIMFQEKIRIIAYILIILILFNQL